MRAVLAALAAACLTSPLAAQAAADSAPRPTPFRAGQWGMEVSINQSICGVGVQHDRRRSRGSVAYDDAYTVWSAGVEGGVGATVRLADDLTLGTLVSGSVSYSGRRTRQLGTRTTFDAVTASLEPARLYLTLFF